mmetsp:Transcript_84573/g.182315  ORF Transcript_84573/g.182315 Transcript_84573/m.182315 type:complete len:110 (+) Transcript_84573:405-734(+)|eukprot:CAMPEP_0116931234 /NCGR_PEP_ID=MMETSP0467-20121206/27689_1 /TAXON_ID=283647 /ORGANISM="Mesodinium pulex, Strain SPMC105" /LENGTH=109 /DNA_ID=CAMNT_0004611623 /DNA_START=402 /DNA_END=731 /DNA_ORIENTATION=-
MFYDDGETVKIIVTVEGLTRADENIVELKSQVRSVSLQIRGLFGKNFQFSVPKLFNRIEEQGNRRIVKDGKVTISLKKKNKSKHWSDLYKVKYIGEKDGDSDKEDGKDD